MKFCGHASIAAVLPIIITSRLCLFVLLLFDASPTRFCERFGSVVAVSGFCVAIIMDFDLGFLLLLFILFRLGLGIAIQRLTSLAALAGCIFQVRTR